MGRFTYTPFKEEEIQPYPNQTYSESFMFRFNNFFCHFIVKDKVNRNGYREPYYNESDKPYILKFSDLSGNRETAIKVNSFQFYKDLDVTVIECGNSNEKIKELIDTWKTSDQLKESTEVLFKALAPIYKGMRNKGYLIYYLWT